MNFIDGSVVDKIADFCFHDGNIKTKYCDVDRFQNSSFR